MEHDESLTSETPEEVGADQQSQAEPEPEPEPAPSEAQPVLHRDLSDWRGKDLLDRDGRRIGALHDVYFDIETDEPQFGTVKQGGLLGKHLTFVPLVGVTIGPGSLQVTAGRDAIKSAPTIALQGDELTAEEESRLYHHYQLNYTSIDNQSGRRLARR
jgi:hypothetical protein